MRPEPDHRVIGIRPGHRVTPRQMTILKECFRSGSQKDAAVALGVRLHTVKQHLTALYRNLGVENAWEAAYRLWLRDAWDEEGHGTSHTAVVIVVDADEQEMVEAVRDAVAAVEGRQVEASP